MPQPQARTALPGGAPLLHPRLSVFSVGKREPKVAFPTLGNAVSGRPIRVSLASKRAPGEPAGHHHRDREGWACSSRLSDLRAPPNPVPDPERRSQSRCCRSSRLAGEHGCLAVLTDVVSGQRALPAHSTALLQQESKSSLGSCASGKLEVRDAWSENPGSRRAHRIARAGLRYRPGALSNC